MKEVLKGRHRGDSLTSSAAALLIRQNFGGKFSSQSDLSFPQLRAEPHSKSLTLLSKPKPRRLITSLVSIGPPLLVYPINPIYDSCIRLICDGKPNMKARAARETNADEFCHRATIPLGLVVTHLVVTARTKRIRRYSIL